MLSPVADFELEASAMFSDQRDLLFGFRFEVDCGLQGHLLYVGLVPTTPVYWVEGTGCWLRSKASETHSKRC
jgi:hypothetical protein